MECDLPDGMNEWPQFGYSVQWGRAPKLASESMATCQVECADFCFMHHSFSLTLPMKSRRSFMQLSIGLRSYPQASYYTL